MEMLIKNAVVVSPADKLNEKTDILIKDGVIAEIGSGITSDGEIIDADGLCAVPDLLICMCIFVIPVRLTKRILSRMQGGCRRRCYKPACNAEHQPDNRQPRNCKVYS